MNQDFAPVAPVGAVNRGMDSGKTGEVGCAAPLFLNTLAKAQSTNGSEAVAVKLQTACKWRRRESGNESIEAKSDRPRPARTLASVLPTQHSQATGRPPNRLEY